MKKIIAFLLALVSAATFAFTAVGCDRGTRAPTDTIRYIVYSSGGSLDDCDRVEAAVNAVTWEKLGFGVDFEYLGYDDYANKLGLYMDSDEDFDMCFTGTILSGLTYSDRASRGYFKDITDLLPEYAPELYNSMSEEVWDAARINGKIYGVINEQIFARSVGLSIETEIANAIGLTQEKIDAENLTYRDCIRQAMEYIADDPEISRNGVIPSTTLVIGEAWSDIFTQNYALDTLGTDAVVPGIIEAALYGADETADEVEVLNQYETSYFKEFLEFCVEMYEKGYITKEQASAPQTKNQRVRITGTYKPGGEAELYNAIGRKFTQFRFGTPLLTTYNVTTSMTAINVRSGNADKCLKFMNLMYTDKAFYNLVAIGEEEVDYDWKKDVDENGELYDYIAYAPSSKYKLNTDWSVGTEFNAYRKYMQNATVVEDTKKLNNESPRSPAYGFTYLPSSSLRTTVDTCYNIANTCIKLYLSGNYDNSKSVDDVISELNAELRKNGLADIINEKQAQLNEFLRNKQ